MRYSTQRVLGLTLVATGLLVVPVGAQAKPGRSYRAVVRTLERSAGRLGRTRAAQKTFSAIRAGRLKVSLRPEAKVIVVTRGLHQTGFFLNAKNTLSAKDSARLRALLRTAAPATTSHTVLRSLLAGTKRFKRRERRLKAKDPLIASLLGKASRAGGSEDVVLWRGKDATLSYRPSTQTLVGSGPFSRTGFFLHQTGKGLEVQDAYREKLQTFLLENAR